MHARLLGTRPLIATLLTSLAVAALGSPARADQIVPTSQPPVVIIRSTSGSVTIARGYDGVVRVAGPDGATATTFSITTDDQGRVSLPSAGGLPSRRIFLPGIRAGATGIRVDDPGGDMTVYLPQHVTALFVKADGGDVAMSRIRGPYLIVAPAGNVDLTNVFGFGNVRTTTGHVNLTGVGGNLHVETTFGTVTGIGMYAQRAEVHTQGGDIGWRFTRVGSGPYRFTTAAGNVHVGLAADAAANIDAQSDQGAVFNRFDRGALVRFRSPHATSFSVGGGGPQITAASQSGTVEIGPHSRPRAPK
jgi:Putative adhesin